MSTSKTMIVNKELWTQLKDRTHKLEKRMEILTSCHTYTAPTNCFNTKDHYKLAVCRGCQNQKEMELSQ